MRWVIYEHIEHLAIKRRFCLWPTKARLDAVGEIYLIVWLEWVEWNHVYDDWTISKTKKAQPVRIRP